METLKTSGTGRILVPEPLAPRGLDRLLKQGPTAEVRTGLKPAEMIAIIPTYDT